MRERESLLSALVKVTGAHRLKEELEVKWERFIGYLSQSHRQLKLI